MDYSERRIPVESDLYDELYIAERLSEPGAWTVEAYRADGKIEQAIFIGPEASERAEAYLEFRYGTAMIGSALPTLPS